MCSTVMWLWKYKVLLVCLGAVQGGEDGLFHVEGEEQYFMSEPSDLVATVGETVALPCRVRNRQGPCQWTREGLGLGMELDLPAYPRFSMADGTCDLTMSPILPQDEGHYKCQVLATPGSAPLSSEPALVTVLAEPGQPHIAQATLGDVLEVTVGHIITLNCESMGGKPAAEIRWTYADGREVSNGVTHKTDVMEDTKTYRTESQLTMKVLHDMTLNCEAMSSAFPTQKQTSLHIRLLHRPRVHLRVNTDKVKEGMTVEIVCSAEVYPAITRYRWFINRQEIQGERGRILRIEEIPRAYDGIQIMCRGSNKVGYDEADTVLTVGFAPQVVTHPRDRVAKEGDAVTFHCVGVGKPPPAYVWLSSSSKKVVSFTQNLTVTASKASELNYICRVFSDGFQPADSKPASLKILSQPDIISLGYKETPRGKLIHCSVKSDSKETKIVWLKGSDPINTEKDEHEIIDTNDGLFHHSYLVFKSKQNENVRYSCFASNEAGSVTQDAPELYGEHWILYVLIFVLIIVLLIIALVSIVAAKFRRLQRESVEKMEQEKKKKSACLEEQPCLGFNNTNHGFVVGGLTPNVSWHSFHTMSSALAQAATTEPPRIH